MNEIPFTEVYWNKWFQLGGIIMFVLGILFSTLIPLINWHKRKAQYYAILLNALYLQFPNRLKSKAHAELFALTASRYLHDSGTEKYSIIWDEDQLRFVVGPRLK